MEAADDDAYRVQAGARFDWNPSAEDLVTFQGDIQRGSRGQGALTDEVFRGGNTVARWNRSWSSASALQLQFYYDHAGRETLPIGRASCRERVCTYVEILGVAV